MEKFGLLNLIKALSGQSEQSNAEGGQACSGGATATDSHAQPGSTSQQYGGAMQQGGASQQANILADVIERHDRISYRLKNKRNK